LHYISTFQVLVFLQWDLSHAQMWKELLVSSTVNVAREFLKKVFKRPHDFLQKKG